MGFERAKPKMRVTTIYGINNEMIVTRTTAIIREIFVNIIKSILLFEFDR